MNKNIGVVIGIIILILIAGVTYASMGKKDDMIKQDAMTEEKKMMEKEDMMKKEAMIEQGDMMKKDETSMMDKDVMTKGSYEAYSPEKVMRAQTGDVVLFFHASWCPSCRGLNSDIEANMNAIPEGVTILKVDYDKETELKKKYGVTTQHTLVQVDKDGNMIKKWSGGSSLANLVSQIQ